MARVNKNIITQGLSGMLGGQVVFSQRADGRTIVSVAPGPSTAPVTPAQLAQRRRFQQAVIYAQGRAQDPATRAAYADAAAERGQSVFNVLVADVLHAPDIQEIDLSGYTGRVGDVIRVTAVDDFEVAEVRVKIENGDGSLVEEGAATRQSDPHQWVYTARVANASLAGDKLTVRASDRPGGIDEEMRTL